MDRIDLSRDTWIETMDGVRYLVTENLTISIEWPERYVEGACTNPSDSDWFEMGLDEDWGASVIWRIPLTDASPVYEHREGEEGLRIWASMDCVALMDASTSPMSVERLAVYLHRRAAIVADTAEQFRALHGELKEARNHEG